MKDELYNVVKIPYAAYQVFFGSPESDEIFVYNQGTNELLKKVSINSEEEELFAIRQWYNHANIMITKGHPWAGETIPDKFLFNYWIDLLKREFGPEDYKLIEDKHKNISITLPYNKFENLFWNPTEIDILSRKDKSIDSCPPLKGKRHDYRNSLLGIVPDFLWDTNCPFIISENHEITHTLTYYEILWMIHDLEEKRGVNPERFILSDCNSLESDYRLELFYEAFPQLQRKVKSKGFDSFEGLTSSFYSSYHIEMRYGIGRVPGQLDYDLTQRRKKKFLFLTRFGRDHRNALILNLNNKGLLRAEDNFYFSYGESKKFVFGPITKEILGDADDKELDRMEEFVDGIPYFLDTPFIEVEEGESKPPTRSENNNPLYYGPTGDTFKILDYAQDSYFNLVNETNCANYSLFLTEKTFKCMAWKQPFIIWGNPHSLRKLHKLGYKTFHPWINEDYDDIMSLSLRLKAVYKEVKKICEMDLEEVHDLYQEMIPIIEHNYENFNYENILRRNYDYTIKEFLNE